MPGVFTWRLLAHHCIIIILHVVVRGAICAAAAAAVNKTRAVVVSVFKRPISVNNTGLRLSSMTTAPVPST